MSNKKKKKRSPFTLAQTWKYCLQMWKFVAENYEGEANDIEWLKTIWTKKNKVEFLFTRCDCFFCDYSNRQENVDCEVSCPGAKVSPRFHCCNKAYSFARNPKKFYQKLKRLDALRRRKEKRTR